MNIITSNRFCFQMAYSDKLRSPYSLLEKLTVIDKLVEVITGHTTG